MQILQSWSYWSCLLYTPLACGRGTRHCVEPCRTRTERDDRPDLSRAVWKHDLWRINPEFHSGVKQSMRHGISKNVVKRCEKMSAGMCDSNPTFPKVSASGQEEDTVSAPISLLPDDRRTRACDYTKRFLLFLRNIKSQSLGSKWVLFHLERQLAAVFGTKMTSGVVLIWINTCNQYEMWIVYGSCALRIAALVNRPTANYSAV